MRSGGGAMRGAARLVERIGEGGHHTYLLDVWGVLVAVIDFELSLPSHFDASEAGVAGLGKLLGGFLGGK